MRNTGAILAAVVLAVQASAMVASAQYSITGLGTLGGEESRARGINNVGQVVGAADTPDGTYHAFLYSNGSMTDLGTLGGSNGAFASEACSINSAGQVVGVAAAPDGGTSHAFLYSNGSMTDLTSLIGLTIYDSLNSINDSGQIVGGITLSGGGSYGCIWNGREGTLTNLNYLTGMSFTPGGINNVGQMIGITVFAGSRSSHAFLYSNGSMTGLGDRSGSYAYASGINDAGQVVGGNNGGAFLYSDGVMTNLSDLIESSSGWTLTGATAINDNGQIAGYGSFAGHLEAFLLTPIHPGDTNNDGAVDVVDLGILAKYYDKATGATWAQADFNGDGAVNVIDLGVLAKNYDWSGPVYAVAPEPAAMVLLSVGLLGLLRYRRK